MSGSSKDACRAGKAYVIDAAGFFAGVQNKLYDGCVATVQEVVDEVKDRLSRRGLEEALAAERLILMEPSEKALRKVTEMADELGELGRLSDTDNKLLALALELINKGLEVVVVSDDRSVQNVALSIGAKVLGIKRMSLRRSRRYVYVCQACGYISRRPGICPKCGSSILKRVREDLLT